MWVGMHKKHQETEICFLVTRKWNFVSKTPKRNYVSTQNKIWFPSHTETEFHFHSKKNSVSGLHHFINPNTLLWYNDTHHCANNLTRCLLPVIVIQLLPFTLLFLVNALLVFLPTRITSCLGFVLRTLPMMQSLKFLKWLPCKGFVIKSATIFLVGHHPMLISFMFTRSVMKKYWMLMCLVRLLLKALPFHSNRIKLLLSCNSKFSTIPYPCDNRK